MIKSVATQDYPYKFMVLVDDCSTDNSYDVVREMLTDVKEDLKDGVRGLVDGLNVILLKNEKNMHQAKTINKAFRFAFETCHLFSILDADDEYLPGKLSKTVAKFLEDPLRIGLIYNDALIHHVETDTYVHEFRRPYDRSVLTRENIISNTPLINKLALQKVGLYDEDLTTCTDWDMWLRITEQFVAIHIPEPLHVYRVTGKNMTWTVPTEQWNKDRMVVHQKLVQRLQNQPS
jgi:glycosyltransferase involved in cell wall biosynthesis